MNWIEKTLKKVDKIFEEMQIQVYQYRQNNNGESPLVVISEQFYEKFLCTSAELMGIKVKKNPDSTILGCKFMVFNALAENEFIIGRGFRVGVEP